MDLVGDNLTQPVVKLYHKALACRGMSRGFWSHEPETDSQVCCQSSTERAKLSLLPAPIVSQPLGLGSGQCTMESIYSVCPNLHGEQVGDICHEIYCTNPQGYKDIATA